RVPRIGAVVDFYGLFPSPPLDVTRLAAPLLAIFAEQDAFIPAEAVEGLRRDLRAAGRSAVVQVQRGAAHGFMNVTRPDRFDAAAAAAGGERLLAFLRAELACPPAPSRPGARPRGRGSCGGCSRRRCGSSWSRSSTASLASRRASTST